MKEEVKYLDDNKARFLENIRTSSDTKKIVERGKTRYGTFEFVILKLF